MQKVAKFEVIVSFNFIIKTKSPFTVSSKQRPKMKKSIYKLKKRFFTKLNFDEDSGH